MSVEGAEVVGSGIRGAVGLVSTAILCSSNQEQDKQMFSTREGNTIMLSHIWLKCVAGRNCV